METLLALLLIVGLIIYFLPTIIASARNSNNRDLIFLINLLTAWTVLAWFILLFWAIMGKAKKRRG